MPANPSAINEFLSQLAEGLSPLTKHKVELSCLVQNLGQTPSAPGENASHTKIPQETDISFTEAVYKSACLRASQLDNTEMSKPAFSQINCNGSRNATAFSSHSCDHSVPYNNNQKFGHHASKQSPSLNLSS